jgi:glutamate decarboxylase
MPSFELISSRAGIPAFAFRVRDSPYTAFDVSEALRTRGWLVPAYTMPPALDHIAVLRIVVRNGFGRDLAALFVDDLTRAVERLSAGHSERDGRVGFHH